MWANRGRLPCPSSAAVFALLRQAAKPRREVLGARSPRRRRNELLGVVRSWREQRIRHHQDSRPACRDGAPGLIRTKRWPDPCWDVRVPQVRQSTVRQARPLIRWHSSRQLARHGAEGEGHNAQPKDRPRGGRAHVRDAQGPGVARIDRRRVRHLCDHGGACPAGASPIPLGRRRWRRHGSPPAGDVTRDPQLAETSTTHVERSM